MDHKNIKLIVRKQLKRQFPHWKRLPKKVKKELARNVLSTVVSEYDLDEMVGFIDMFNNNRIINRLLAYDGYCSAMREFFPANLLRAELPKAIKYPEISYLKFCWE